MLYERSLICTNNPSQSHLKCSSSYNGEDQIYGDGKAMVFRCTFEGCMFCKFHRYAFIFSLKLLWFSWVISILLFRYLDWCFLLVWQSMRCAYKYRTLVHWFIVSLSLLISNKNVAKTSNTPHPKGHFWCGMSRVNNWRQLNQCQCSAYSSD
jgi:hypothetical protein